MANDVITVNVSSDVRKVGRCISGIVGILRS